MKTQEIQHLYWRAGFGITPKAGEQFEGQTRQQVVTALFENSRGVNPLKMATPEFDKLATLSFREARKEFRKLAELGKTQLMAYNRLWVERLLHSDAVLQERMTLFWANHFVCRDTNMYYAKQYHNLLRFHALGDFKAFVKAVSKAPSMLKYLNNIQNKKAQPNENFARELMELFTLGTGHYTEKDVKESARAFSGYFHTVAGDFIIRSRQQDTGVKTFLGKTGNFDGDAIIDILLEQPQCAQFICDKVYRYFVNPIPNQEHIKQMVRVFYPNYNIRSLMEFVFMADWFYASEQQGAKIKSPIDLWVGMYRSVPYYLEDTSDVLKIQRLLGQILLNPPNVAGWPGNRAWIDSNTLLLRLRLPSQLLNEGHIESKNDTRWQRYRNTHGIRSQFLKASVDWNRFEKEFEEVSVETLAAHLLQTKISAGTQSYLERLDRNSKKNYCIQLMSLPEYQMC